MTADPPAESRSRRTSDPLWTRYLRREVQYALDGAALAAAFAVAYLLRFDFEIPPDYLRAFVIQLPLVVAVQFIAVRALGTYNFVWRYVGMTEIRTFLRAALYSSLPLLLLRLGLPESLAVLRIPRSIIVIDTLLAFGGLLALRVVRRALYESHEKTRRETSAKKRRKKATLLVGAGRAGLMAVREIQGRGDMDIDIVGLVDDELFKRNTVIGGLPVLGTTDDIPTLVGLHRIDQVVITIAEAPAATIRRVVEICERAGVRPRIIPGYYELLAGSVAISRFRDVEIEDLLGREPVRLDERPIRDLVTGKVILVTGAGGSIGAELARQIARFNPLALILVERSEAALFEIDREIAELWPQLDLRALVADVADAPRIRSILDRHRPQAIFHAAAHKHVPMMEANAIEAVKNNVFATRTIANLAADAGVDVFVLISTDKAVRPTSVMGATKRLAELVVQDLDRCHGGTRFLAVRFGNVLGSAGSVVPIFKRQIATGGPVTVTHPDTSRYFMTIPEAAQLVLQAGAIGEGGQILFLDMGEPVKILDLAVDMITLSGYRPYEDIPIVFTGLRRGEKMREELELSGEGIRRTSHPKIYVGQFDPMPTASLGSAVAALEEAVAAEREVEVRVLLGELVPEASLERSAQPPVTPPSAARSERVH